MKHTIPVHDFSFNKIKNGSRKISIHLLDKRVQQINLHDTLEVQNTITGETLECEVIGTAIFDDFSDLIDALGPQSLGYDDKKEIMLRLERVYPPEACNALNAIAFFIKLIQEPMYHFRPAIERE